MKKRLVLISLAIVLIGLIIYFTKPFGIKAVNDLQDKCFKDMQINSSVICD